MVYDTELAFGIFNFTAAVNLQSTYKYYLQQPSSIKTVSYY